MASQRGRLVDAMTKVITEKGYQRTTVGDVVARAGVSRRTFYEQFPDLESCFIAAYDTGVEFVLGRLRDAIESLETDDWRSRLEVSIATFMETLADEPAFAHALHLETLTAGPRALARRAEVFALIAELWRRLHARAREEDPSIQELPDEAFLALTGGHDELIRECLRTRGAGALPDLISPAARVAAALF